MNHTSDLEKAKEHLLRVENIGMLRYIGVSTFGKHFQADEICFKRESDSDGQEIRVEGDFIVSVGKSAIVVTDQKGGKRVPVLVRQWSRDTPMFPSKFSCYFVDGQAQEWTVITGTGGQLLTTRDGVVMKIRFR